MYMLFMDNCNISKAARFLIQSSYKLYSSVGILPVWFTWKHEQTNTESSNNDDNPPFKR